ncbi:PRE-binding protein [Hepatocystis sp. ex Piliocolobus tephrosceles]|nr:PRE-binding protein [Hepatocystis sp. ex Piliocolobus tephrosceles]
MNFLANLGKKSKSTATTVKKNKNDDSSETKTKGSKLNEKIEKVEPEGDLVKGAKNEKKDVVKGTELTATVKLNGHVKNKKENTEDSNKLDDREKKNIVKVEENNTDNTEIKKLNEEDKKKKKKNKNKKKGENKEQEEELDSGNEETIISEQMNEQQEDKEQITEESSNKKKNVKNVTKSTNDTITAEGDKKSNSPNTVHTKNAHVTTNNTNGNVKTNEKKKKGTQKEEVEVKVDIEGEVEGETGAADVVGKDELKQIDETKNLKRMFKLLDDERKKTVNELNKKITKVIKKKSNKSNGNVDLNEINETEEKKRVELENIINEINIAVTKNNTIPNNSNNTAATSKYAKTKLTCAEIENRIKEVKLQKKKTNTKEVEQIKEIDTYITFLEEQLCIAKNYDNFKTYQNQLYGLKTQCKEEMQKIDQYLNTLKEQEKTLAYTNKIIKMKEEQQGIKINASNVFSKEYVIKNDKYNMLTKPFNFIKRIANKYCVFIDRLNTNENKSYNLLIVGCNEDIESCISFLENINNNERNVVQINKNVVKNMFNIVDGKIKKIEEDTNVFIQLDSNDCLYYCGMKQDIHKLKKLIEEATEEHNSYAKSMTKSINLNYLKARGFDRSLLKSIEQNTNTMIRIKYDVNTKEAVAEVKGKNSTDIEEAEKQICNLVDSLHTKSIEYGKNERFNIVRRCGYELNDIKNKLNVFVMRNDTGFDFVGSEENIKKAQEVLDYALNVKLITSIKKTLTEEESYLFNANFRNQIKAKTGAEVKIYNKDDYKELNISGNKTDIDNALQMIEELLREKKCTEIAINEDVIALLLSAKAQKIKDIEKDTCTSIQINKNTYVAQIYGSEANIKAAKDILEHLVKTEKRHRRNVSPANRHHPNYHQNQGQGYSNNYHRQHHHSSGGSGGSGGVVGSGGSAGGGSRNGYVSGNGSNRRQARHYNGYNDRKDNNNAYRNNNKNSNNNNNNNNDGGNYVTIEMTVDTEHIGSIIGKRGRTINKIQEDTLVKKINIDKYTKKVLIYGGKKNVEAAQKEIEKILTRAKEENNNFDTQKQGSNSYLSHRRNYNNNSTRGGDGKKNYRSDSTKRNNHQQVYINTNDEKAFPSLLDVTNIQSRKSKKAINQANTKRQDGVQDESVYIN